MNISNLKFEFESKIIEFNIKYSNRKTISIEVLPSLEVRVKAPIFVTEGKVIEIVKNRAKWILEKQYYMKNIKSKEVHRKAASGEHYLYLGKNYTLELLLGKDYKKINVKLFRGKLIITTYTKNEQKLKLALEKWYREKALIKISERIKYYGYVFGKKPRNVRVKEQKRRWASCTWRDDILFNWRCVMAPLNVIDYIVVHEMCHMYQKNHSKYFWNKVRDVMPDYEEKELWLKENGIKMDL